MKITTHVYGKQFTAEIDGVPLMGSNGCYSRFYSRKEARKAAEERCKQNSKTKK